MACKRPGNPLEIDPDYQPVTYYNAKRMRHVEQDAKDATIKKIQNITKSQFSKSISEKEMEIQIISDRLQQARTQLDKLRAYVAAQFYGASDKLPLDKGQDIVQPIHPAVKSLFLGKKPKDTSSSQSHTFPNNSGMSCTSVSSLASNSMDEFSQNRVNCLNVGSASLCGGEVVEEKASGECPGGVRAARFKICKKIIVGNVSKFIPPDKREGNDHATHKWMVYVRGPKEEPSIDHVVKKVCFFLHPSYRPNDLIEVTKPPFHLTRRGWGEFPVRVQIHFHDPRNKPIDVVHMLKLDRTYTGLQTLGSETVVTPYLYKPDTVAHFDTSSPHLSSRTDSTEDEDSNSVTDACIVTAHDEDSSASTSTWNNIDQNAMNPLNNVQIKQEKDNIQTIPSLLDLLNIVKVKTEPVSDFEDTHSNSKNNDSSSGVKTLQQTANQINNSSIVKSSLPTIATASQTVSNCSSSFTKVVPKTVTRNVLSQQITTESASGSILVPQGLRLPTGAVSLLRNNRLAVTSKPDQQEPKHVNKSDGSSLLLVVPSTSSVPVLATSRKDVSKETDAKNSVLCAKPSLSTVLVISGMKNNSPSAQVVTVSSPQMPQSSVKVSQESILPQVIINTQQLSPAKKTVQIRSNIPNNAHVTPTKNIGKDGTVLLVPQHTLLRTKVGLEMSLLAEKTGTVQATSHQIQHPEMKSAYLQFVSPEATVTTQTQLVQKTQPLSYVRSKQKTSNETKLVPSTQNHASSQKAESSSMSFEDLLPAKNSDIICIEKCRTMEEVLKLFIKKFPLAVNNPDKTVHPYAASSMDGFLSWPVGKQRAAEWQRARSLRLAVFEAFGKSDYWSEKKVWNTKKILLWCRQYGYTPLKHVVHPLDNVEEEEGIHLEEINTLSECKELWKKLEEFKPVPVENEVSSEEEIDIVTTEKSPICVKQETTSRANSRLAFHVPISPGADFVQDEACKIGVKFQPAEVHPGILMSVAEEMIFQATKSFAEELLRGSLSFNFDRHGNKRYSPTVTLDDVFQCIKNKQEFGFLSNQNLGKDVVNEKKTE